MKKLMILVSLFFLAACATTSPRTDTATGKYLQEYEDIHGAYEEFLGFRDDQAFLEEGFTEGSVYSAWMKKVQGLQQRPGYPENGPRLLTMLAMSTRQFGTENELTKQLTFKFDELLDSIRISPDSLLTFFYTGDTQGNLKPSGDSELGGLSGRAAIVEAARAKEAHFFLVDAGDVFAVDSDMRAAKALIEAMNIMRYDVMAAGPNELRLGEIELRALIQDAKFPIISSNVEFAGEPLFKPYALVERDGFTVGVLGITPMVSEMTISGAKVVEPRQALERYLPELKKKAQIILLLTQYKSTEAASFIRPEDGISTVFCDADSKAINAPIYIFPAEASGRSIGYFRLEKESDGSFQPFSQTKIPVGSDAQNTQIQELLREFN